jgi:putative SOS response-associated peptidase YedK
MCGRYELNESREDIRRRFRLEDAAEFERNGDVRPTNTVPVVRLNAAGRRECVLMRWGLVPHWSKELKLKYPTFNARAESADKLPSFREAFKKRHCLVPVSSFFEWPILDGKKRKCRISMQDGSVFALAGLWESWRDKDNPDAEPVLSFTIITTTANADMAPYHDRMPVIVEPGHYEWWLDANADNPHALLVPYLESMLRIAPV